MATKYGEWGARFQNILYAFRFDLNVSDLGRSWNVFQMPHRGRHPAEYHEWVLENFQLAAETAGEGNTAEFLALFKEWVVDRVLEDPTTIRAAYLKCHR